MVKPIRILIADEHPVVRHGLCELLAGEAGIEVVCVASEGSETVRQTIACQPDVIIMDLLLPNRDGVEAIREIRRTCPNVNILVLSTCTDETQVVSAIQIGATSYMLKSVHLADLVDAIRDTAIGRPCLHPTVKQILLTNLSASPVPEPDQKRLNSLTRREGNVLRLMAYGRSNLSIAKVLGISDRAVRLAVASIVPKLGVENRTQAVLFALTSELVTLDEVRAYIRVDG